ncbi:MAG: hypothetical protein RDU25_04690 [Patescibacteria group bacterium]|nr:hypothetical protein [Patescibacteria group bacterium]
MQDDEQDTDGEPAEERPGWPFGALVGVAPIFFLTFMLNVWVMNMLRNSWRIELPSDYLNTWLFGLFMPFVAVGGLANHKFLPRITGPLFVWVIRFVLAANMIVILVFPVIHAWTFGAEHWDCFRNPAVWLERHGEAEGVVSGYRCADEMHECVVGRPSERKSGIMVKFDALPWYEPHFAIDEQDCRFTVIRMLHGEALPRIGRRVSVRRDLCVAARLPPPGAFRVLP